MKFIDLFAGIGGFRRGMEMAGHECVGFCEFDKYATASYTAMHLCSDDQLSYIASLPKNKRVKEILNEKYRNGEWYCDDVRSITGDTIPKADCWCFGAPCQDFSVAGKRAGLEGNRSSLVREVFRILKEIGEDDRPEWLVYENVKGMLSSNNGFDFLAILSEMDDLGYDCEWQMYNSKYFVPQNRERVYLVGHLRSRGGREVFPLCSANEANSVPVKILGHHKAYRRNTQIFAQDGITEALSTCQGGGREHYTALPVGFNTMPDGTCRTLKYQYQKNSLANFTIDGDRGASAVLVKFANGIIGDESDVAQCLSSSGPAKEGMRTHQTMNRVVIPVLTPERSVKRQNGRRFKEDGECSFTLTSIDRHGVAIGIDGDGEHDIIDVELPNGETVSAIWYPKYDCYIAIRKLTPKECFRLQGWSDDYFVKAELVNSDSQLYKQAGNGVTVDVVYDLARRIDVNITVEDINE